MPNRHPLWWANINHPHPVRQIHVRSPQSQSPPCLSNSGTALREHRHGHTPRSVPGGIGMYWSGEKYNHPLLFSFESWLCSAPFIMIFVHNMLEQTISFTKAHRVLHVHLLRGRQAERRAFSPEGRNSWAGFQSQRAALDLMRKEVYRGSPIFIPSIWCICDSHEHSALAKAGAAPWEMLVKAPSLKRAFRERRIRSGSRSQYRQSAPSRAVE